MALEQARDLQRQQDEHLDEIIEVTMGFEVRLPVNFRIQLRS